MSVELGAASHVGTAVPACKAAGVTYRQFYSWQQRGTIRLERPASGSGTLATVTPAEAAALCDLAAELRDAEARLRYLRSGDYFAKRVAVHEREGT